MNEGSQETYVKVWDMLDPWDYQVFLTMLAKEVNSNSTYDTMLGTQKVWETVMNNIDAAFSQATPIYICLLYTSLHRGNVLQRW